MRGWVDSGRGGDPGRKGGVSTAGCRDLRGREGPAGSGVTALCPLNQQDSIAWASRGHCSVLRGAEAVGRCGLESQLCLNGPGGPGVVPTSLARPGPALPRACCLQDTPLVLLGPHAAPSSLLLCGVVSGHTAPGPLRSHRGLGNGQNPPAPRGPPAEFPVCHSQRAGVLGKAAQFPLSSCPSRWPGQGGITKAGSSRTSAGQLAPTAPRVPHPPGLRAEQKRQARPGLGWRSGLLLRKEPSVQSPGQAVADAGRAGRVSSQHCVQSLSSAHPF